MTVDSKKRAAKTRQDPFLEACAREPETDIGNARRFLKRHGQDVLHVTNVGWHVFDGTRWKEDDSGSLTRRAAHQTMEAIFDECAVVADADDRERDILDQARIARENLDRPRVEGRGASAAERTADAVNRMAWTTTVKAAEELEGLIADRSKGRNRFAKSSCGTSKINNTLQEAAAYRPAAMDDLNKDLYAVNVANGTLRFYREEDEESEPDDPRFIWRVRLDPHRREDLLSKLSPHEFTLDGPDPKEWIKFLVRVQPSPAMRDYLKRLAGYSLLGINTEQMIAFFYGIGRNGKSTFVDTLARLLADYAVTLSIDSFAGDDRKGGGEATPDLARLPGARFVAASEPEAGVQFKEALIKRLTGGESLAVRRLHQDFFEFQPQFTLIVSGNHKPVIKGNDDGIWRRIHLVPWGEQIPKNEVDKDLPRKLDAEASAILKWMVEGALEFLNRGGLDAPRDILDATQEYREEEDPIGGFIRNACTVTGDAEDTETPLDLFMAFEKWASATGAVKLKETTFNRRLPDAAQRTWPTADGQGVQQFHKAKSNGGRFYRGIAIRAEWRHQHQPKVKEGGEHDRRGKGD